MEGLQGWGTMPSETLALRFSFYAGSYISFLSSDGHSILLPLLTVSFLRNQAISDFLSLIVKRTALWGPHSSTDPVNGHFDFCHQCIYFKDWICTTTSVQLDKNLNYKITNISLIILCSKRFESLCSHSAEWDLRALLFRLRRNHNLCMLACLIEFPTSCFSWL